MTFLFNKDNHFNLANIVTFFNIAAGIMAIYFITHQEFFGAALFAWLAGAFDILDGKIARKYNLSTEFGVQLDSFGDFLSFVIVHREIFQFRLLPQIQHRHLLVRLLQGMDSHFVLFQILLPFF